MELEGGRRGALDCLISARGSRSERKNPREVRKNHLLQCDNRGLQVSQANGSGSRGQHSAHVSGLKSWSRLTRVGL